MKGSAITGPVAKEAAELWPVSNRFTESVRYAQFADMVFTAYRLQLWCCHVSGCLSRETVHLGGVRAAFQAQASSMIPCRQKKRHFPLSHILHSKSQPLPARYRSKAGHRIKQPARTGPVTRTKLLWSMILDILMTFRHQSIPTTYHTEKLQPVDADHLILASRVHSWTNLYGYPIVWKYTSPAGSARPCS